MEREQKKNIGRHAKSIFNTLRNLLTSLPSKTEKEEAEVALNTLIVFLQELKQKIISVPSIEDMEQVKNAILQLEDALGKARSNPLLAQALGLRQPPRSRPSTIPVITEIDRQLAASVISDFQNMNVEEIPNRLNELSLTQLRAIAENIGIRTTQKISRNALAHQITKKIENERGYKQLRGETPGEIGK